MTGSLSGAHERRTVTVPEGLAGERVDAAMARMFGLSRTRAADLISAGHVTVDGRPPSKSDRVEPGDRKSTRLNSSHPSISYAVFCLKKKKITASHAVGISARD